MAILMHNKEWIISKRVGKTKRGQGFEDSSEMLRNYKDLKVWATRPNGSYPNDMVSRALMFLWCSMDI